MKMFNKNGNFTPLARSIYNNNLERLRAGDDPRAIAHSLMEQVKLVEYNGGFLDEDGLLSPTYFEWNRIGLSFTRPPQFIVLEAALKDWNNSRIRPRSMPMYEALEMRMGFKTRQEFLNLVP